MNAHTSPNALATLSMRNGTGHEPLTMSSREIADLCEARHNDVVATIERLFEKGVLRESRKTTRTHRPEGGGRPTEVYDLTKRDTLVVVAGYNDDVRARIIDRWMELEAHVAPQQQPSPFQIPKTFPEALRLAAEQAERASVAEEKLAIAAPKAEALDALAKAEGVCTLGALAKNLGLPPRVGLVNELVQRGVLFRSGPEKDLLPTEYYRRSGYFVVKTHPITRNKIRKHTYVTPKGQVWMARNRYWFEVSSDA